MMLSLTNSLKEIGAALNAALEGKTYHYFRPKNKYPVCVWQEDGEATSMYSGNTKTEQGLHGTIDYYTQLEYDPDIDTIQNVLDSLGCAWSINSVQYEEDTKLIHYEWEWEVRVSG